MCRCRFGHSFVPARLVRVCRIGCFGHRIALAAPAIMPAKSASSKKAAKAKGKATPKKDAEAATVDDVSLDLVSNHLAEVHKAVEVIMNHEFFKDISDAAPLTIEQGGSQAVFCQDECSRIAGRGGDEAGCALACQPQNASQQIADRADSGAAAEA